MELISKRQKRMRELYNYHRELYYKKNNLYHRVRVSTAVKAFAIIPTIMSDGKLIWNEFYYKTYQMIRCKNIFGVYTYMWIEISKDRY